MLSYWLIVLGVLAFPSCLLANDFKNPDFADGLTGWSFDGKSELVYLLPNQKEGKTTDPNAYLAVKLTAFPTRAAVMFQDLASAQPVETLNLQVDVLPASDFKRIMTADTMKGIDIGRELAMEEGGPFDADFFFRGPRWYLKLFSLQIGSWNHLDANFPITLKRSVYHVEFDLSPGTGAVYLTSPSATLK